MTLSKHLFGGLPVDPLPKPRSRTASIAHAPVRNHGLDKEGQKVLIRTLFQFVLVTPLSLSPQLALSNALRYFEPALHPELAREFAEELRTYGHIYMYRFIPGVELRLVQ